MSTDAKPRAVGYARYSPRPLKAKCACGWTWNVEATAEDFVEEPCPQCGAQVKIRNCESCESQEADIRRHCSRRGLELVSFHMDKALSGSDSCHDRPGLFDAKVACKRGYTLIVRNLDRLFRDMDKAALFSAELKAKGVRIVSLEQPEANDTTTGKLMTAIYNWMAEIKREEIRARTRSKMLQYQAAGRKMSSLPPFGYSIDPGDPKTLIPNPEEQATVASVINLHREGRNLRQIARILEASGVPRRGKPTWNHQLVRAILVRAGELA